MIFESLDSILSRIVGLANISGGEIFIENFDFDKIEAGIKTRVINTPDYWFKNKENGYILNIKSNEEDTFLKSETEYGYEFKRFIIKDDKVALASKETRENLLISEKEVLVKCNSFLGEMEVIDYREIRNKVNTIKDDLILFVKRNLLYSKEKLWNIPPEMVEMAINKTLYEYSYENNFPIELSVYDSKKLVIKYFLGHKKDRRYVELLDVKDEYLFGNKIRVLTLIADEELAPKVENLRNKALKEEVKAIKTEETKQVKASAEKVFKDSYSSSNLDEKTKRFNIMLETSIKPVTSKAIMLAIGLKDRETFYNNYLKPAIRDGYIQYTIPEKPRSPKQRYLITKEGLDILKK